MNYYSAIIYLAVVSLVVLFLQLKSNAILLEKEKRGFAFAVGIVVIVSLAEWLGVVLDGKPAGYRILHMLVKCVEFSLAPMVPVALVGVFRSKRKLYPVIILFGIHAFLELVSLPFGYIFCIDQANCYHRSGGYWIYMLFYLFGLVFFFVEIMRLNRVYQKRNMVTLVGTVFFLITGISFQVINSDIRTDWITIAMGLLLLYAYYCDLVLQVDALTMLLNRRCYEKELEHLSYRTAIIMFDVDGFKEINDNYGHQYGDVILRKIADTIKEAYSSVGYCYRIGGDEFCVLLKRGKLDEMPDSMEEYVHPGTGEIIEMPVYPHSIQSVNQSFEKRLQEQRLEEPLLPEVSLGYVFYHGKEDIADAIKTADELMYEKKRLRKKSKER